MESNKLLIGVQFNDEHGASIVMELIVLRDITLKQLLDGIKYGIDKKKSNELYRVCRNIFENCIQAVDPNGIFRKITLTSHNDALMSEKDSRNRVILHREHLGKMLYELGFITSTKIVFDCTETYQSFEVNTQNIIPAFNPGNKENTNVIFPEYNISTRQMYRFDHSPVEIIPPGEPPKKPEQNLFFTMLPTVLMISAMILVRGLMTKGSSNGMSMVALSATMGVVTLVTSVLNYVRQKKKYKKEKK